MRRTWLAAAALSLAGLAVAPAAAPAAELDPAQGLQTPAGEIRLTLPEGSPEAFTVDVALGGRTRTLVLERRSWRAPGFRVLAGGPGGGLEEVEAPRPRTYRGRIEGEQGSDVVALLADDGLWASVLGADEGERWRIRPARAVRAEAPRSSHAVDSVVPWQGARCGDDLLHPAPGSDVGAAEGGDRSTAAAASSGQTLAEISFDADNAYYVTACGSARQTCIDKIDWIVAQTEQVYARDVEIVYSIVEIVVRETPYYSENGDAGRILEEFRDEWNSNPAYQPRDLAHLMTERSTPGIGGVAYAGCVICGEWAYGLSHDSADIVMHEIGHNWSLPHCADPPEAPFQRNIMCGGDRQIGANDTDSVRACKSGLACLDAAPPYSDPLAPYAYPDHTVVSDDALGEIRLEPVANDDDGNDDALSLARADAFSTRQGSVSISPGTGPGGGDEIVYRAPAGVPFLGTDKLLYEVEDSTGLRRTGLVKIEVTTPEIAAYWPLDETTGTVAEDRTAFERDGTLGGLSFDSHSVPGRFGGALDFTGNGQSVSVGAEDVPPPWSVSLWVQRHNPANPSSALMDSASYSIRLEQWPVTFKVGLTHYGVGDFIFDYEAPIGVWTHLVFVGTDAETQLWVDGALADTLAVPIRAPMGTLGKGGDGGLRAALDDVRVFNHALDSAAIADLLQGGRATAPRPRNGEHRAAPDTVLSWAAGGEAIEHDVYFGTDEAAVAAADTASPEYRGRQTGTTYDPEMSVDATYYWRVDEVLSGGGTLTGDVWRLSTVGELLADLVGHLPMDLTTMDYSGHLAGGSPYGGPALIEGTIDDALDLAAAGQYLWLPQADDVPPPWTVSMWVRRQPSPGPAAALLDGATSSIRLEQWFDTEKVGITRYGVADYVFDYEAPVGLWVNLVFVGTSVETRLYVDGILTDTIPESIALPRERIGNTNGDLRATLDDVAMWDRALTDDEIASIHGEGVAGRSFACTRGVPGEATGFALSIESPGSTVATLSWDAVAGSESYDVFRGLQPDLSDLTCLLTGVDGTSAEDDGALPPPGDVYHYLVAAVTCAGRSSLGSDGAGVERPVAPACP